MIMSLYKYIRQENTFLPLYPSFLSDFTAGALGKYFLEKSS